MENANMKSYGEMLRQKAEELLEKTKAQHTSELRSETDLMKLIHELEVHQIELEMQNDELIMVKEQAELASEKYIELYDFAPSGYVTLSDGCHIQKINLTGASMLGKERSHLINSHFCFFVTEDTRPIFNAFFENIFKHRAKETCQVMLTKEGRMPIFVQIDGILTENGKECYLILTDITERMRADEAKKRSNELQYINSLFVGRELRVVELKKEVNELLIRLGEKEKYHIVEQGSSKFE